MKALGLVVSDKKNFENCSLKTYFWPRDLLMQPTGTIWTTLVKEHLRIIPVKFGQNPMSGFKEEVVWMKKLTHWRTDTLKDDGQRTVTKVHSKHFVLRWANDYIGTNMSSATVSVLNHKTPRKYTLYMIWKYICFWLKWNVQVFKQIH